MKEAIALTTKFASVASTVRWPRRRTSRLLSALVLALLPMSPSLAQSSDDMNAANNPLQPSLALNLQDDYTGSYYNLNGADSNALLLRGAVPHLLFGIPQLLRATLPVATTPSIGPNGRVTNLGDLNVFDVAIFKAGPFEIGVGPQLTAPTAGDDLTGTGKWQAGIATLAISPQSWGLIGGLVTWQHSFAGSSTRPTQNNLQAQPFFIYNLPRGWYFRSTATWTWDLQAGTHYLPIGAGLGKVWVDNGGTTYNLFAEPQFTVAREGVGVPHFQVFFGLNMQFPIKGVSH
jgi:hypothetical protein